MWRDRGQTKRTCVIARKCFRYTYILTIVCARTSHSTLTENLLMSKLHANRVTANFTKPHTTRRWRVSAWKSTENVHIVDTITLQKTNYPTHNYPLRKTITRNLLYVPGIDTKSRLQKLETRRHSSDTAHIHNIITLLTMDSHSDLYSATCITRNLSAWKAAHNHVIRFY